MQRLLRGNALQVKTCGGLILLENSQVISVISKDDVSHIAGYMFEDSFDRESFYMTFSKSFGYALRGILYVAMMSDENRKIRIDEMANRLSVPRHFLGKIMNRVVKKGILNSIKGPNGGFSLNNTTLKTNLLTLLESIDGLEQFEGCVLRLRKCSAENPCPLHHRLETYRNELQTTLVDTEIGSLLKEDKPYFIRSISAMYE